MSDETRARLERERERLAEMSVPVGAAKQALLHAIEQDLPDRMERVGKRWAQEQPDVTRSLGVSGIGEFRAALRAFGAQVGSDLRASDEIDWPRSSGMGPMNVRNGFQRALGKHERALTRLLEQYGFNVNRYGANDEYSEVSVWDVCDASAHRAETQRYIEAAQALPAQQRLVEQAKAEDDAAAVAELWGDER